MEKPSGYIWEYPGFPSLVVPYGATNDFFFSGHVAGQVITILEFRNNKMWYMEVYGWISVIMTWILMWCT